MFTMPVPSQATVRMYRAGFGDCFLVSLDIAGQARPFHMLIDCGIWQSAKNNVDRLRAAVGHIKEVTQDHLDVLVVTHEHKDHVSGFGKSQAADLFDSIRIDAVWLAWTENMSDRLARSLRKKYMETHKKLLDVLKGFRASARGLDTKKDRDHYGRLTEQMELILGSVSVAAAGKGAAPGQVASLAGMEWVKRLKERTPPTVIKTWKPGQSIKIPGGRALVLGPPRKETALRREEASAAEKRDDEVYTHKHLGSAGWAMGADAMLFALNSRGVPGTWDRGRPFRTRANEHSGVMTIASARRNPFFRDRYFGIGRAAGDTEAWRRIDGDWLASAAELALRMQDFTNNTSLVLALELGPSNKVLLFPGDAQFGNWTTWDDVKFEDDPDLTAEDLLRRTVLYKVGHHGSHNATLRKRGLERMTSPELAAMVPVDGEFVKEQEWNMPYPPMFNDLVNRAKGRVLRADSGLGERPANVDPDDWRRFVESTTIDPRYVEYRIDL